MAVFVSVWLITMQKEKFCSCDPAVTARLNGNLMYPYGFGNAVKYGGVLQDMPLTSGHNPYPNSSGYQRLGSSWTPTQNTVREAKRDVAATSYATMPDWTMGTL